jgi:hypothetical protein
MELNKLTARQLELLNLGTGLTRSTWSINPATGLIDIKGDFIFQLMVLNFATGNKYRALKSPLRGLRFGDVTGNFIFQAETQIETLDGFPQKVGGNFDCSRNGVGSLEGGPKEVGGDYICSFNRLKDFKHAPENINGNFSARFSGELLSFDGLPKSIVGDLDLRDGYPWETELDLNKISTLTKSDIKGEKKIDRAYLQYQRLPIGIKGINKIKILKNMLKRDITKEKVEGILNSFNII